MSLDHVELHELRGQLLMRPLNAVAIRCAHRLATHGLAEPSDATERSALLHLSAAGLAFCTSRGAEVDAFVPTRLLSALHEANRMGELEPRR